MPRLHLGTHDTDRRLSALQALAAEVGATGQRGPSWHVLIQVLADAADYDLENTTERFRQLWNESAGIELD